MKISNVKKLIIWKISHDAIKPGGDPLVDVVSLFSGDNLKKCATNATEWVNLAISAVKTAPDNPFGDDDEAIAGEILRRIDIKLRERK